MKKYNIAILAGYDNTIDKDAVGQYSEILYKHLNENKPVNIEIVYEQFRPKNMIDWFMQYTKIQKKYDLIHLQYPISSWGIA